MNSDDEEKLAAFLDGQIDDAEAEAFEARLAAEPDLAARAEAWLANDRRIVAAFAPVAEMPVPAALMDKLQTAGPSVSAANDNPPWWRRHALPLGGALAASLAAVMMLAPRPESAGPKDLAFALNTGRSLAPVRIADGRTITPTMTVRAADGRYCREYQENQTLALACRKDGRWTVEAQAKGAGPEAQNGIAVAGGADSAALAQAYARIGASDPLSAAEENRLISKSWSAN